MTFAGCNKGFETLPSLSGVNSLSSVEKDSTPPVVTITAKPPASTAATTADFSFTAADADSGLQGLTCQLDNATAVVCTGSTSYAGLTVANHTFQVKALDKAGNQMVASYAWTVTAATPPARPWDGVINGVPMYIPDLNKPIRGAVFINFNWVARGDQDWRALEADYNLIEVYPGAFQYTAMSASAKLILQHLTAASAQGALPVAHPEIQYLPVILWGFSAGSAAMAGIASDSSLSNADPTKAPQRVLAVVTMDEIDSGPYLPPLGVPHLYVSDPHSDQYGSLLSHEASSSLTNSDFARNRATTQGAPLSVVTQAGHFHGGYTWGIYGRTDYKFTRVWLSEVLKQRLPAQQPTNAAVILPSWQNRAAWVGTYDVVTNMNTAIWPGRDEHMTNVVISPLASYKDSRQSMWLPSQYCAEVWQTYVNTGSMPSLNPAQAAVPQLAFTRKNSMDTEINVNAGSTAKAGAAPVDSRDGTTLTILVSFDRAITAAKVSLGAGSATLSGDPIFWTNTVTINLANVTNAQALQLNLSDITSVDGSPHATATVTLRKLIGDVNGDGKVDAADLALVNKNIGQTAPGGASGPWTSDVNADGKVDAADVALVNQYLGKQLP